jgi:hypothetical protein
MVGGHDDHTALQSSVYALASTPWTWQRGTIPWCHTERVAERHRMCDLWLHGHPAARRADVTAMVP